MVFKQVDTSIQKLQQQVTGTIVTPDDADYHQARLGFNRSTDQYPALILIANDAQDVVAGVRFANEAGLGVVVQSTGHGIQQPADDNMMIITSRMSAAQVDIQARTARVEAGVIWEQV